MMRYILVIQVSKHTICNISYYYKDTRFMDLHACLIFGYCQLQKGEYNRPHQHAMMFLDPFGPSSPRKTISCSQRSCGWAIDNNRFTPVFSMTRFPLRSWSFLSLSARQTPSLSCVPIVSAWAFLVLHKVLNLTRLHIHRLHGSSYGVQDLIGR